MEKLEEPKVTGDQSRGSMLAKDIGISSEHEGDMEDIIGYMEKFRMQELFNEIMTRILEERPSDVKSFIVDYLQHVHKVPNTDPHCQREFHFQDPKGEADVYLNQDDFESLFDSYDVLGIQSVSIKYLTQAMKVVGVEDAEKILKERYQELCKDEFVNKVSFVYVL